VVGHHRKPARLGHARRPRGSLDSRPRNTPGAAVVGPQATSCFTCTYNPAIGPTGRCEEGTVCCPRTGAFRRLGCAPLAQPPCPLLPDYRFRLPIVPKGSFFSILRVFPVVPREALRANPPQVVLKKGLVAIPSITADAPPLARRISRACNEPCRPHRISRFNSRSSSATWTFRWTTFPC